MLYCQSTEQEYKAGFTKAGSQRYQCQQCKDVYSPEPQEIGCRGWRGKPWLSASSRHAFIILTFLPSIVPSILFMLASYAL